MANPDQNALTDSAWWDDAWLSRRSGAFSRRHYLYGEHGIFLRALERQAGPLRQLRVVEFGGAGSRFLLALAKWRDCQVTAVDYSPVGLAATEALFAANRCRVRTVLSDIFTWGEGEEFDLVTHWGLLEHFVDPVPLLARSAALASPGGQVVFSMPNLRALGAALWRRWSPNNWSKHIWHSDDAVRRGCEGAGLTPVRAFHWGPPLVQVGRWERHGLLQLAASALQVSLFAPAVLLPLYATGSSRSASQRGFIARRPERGVHVSSAV